MKLFTRSALLAMAGAVLCATPSLRADQLTLTAVAPNLNNAGGAYVGPYQGTVGGVAEPIICDDYKDDSYVGEVWNATPTNIGAAVSNPSLFTADHTLGATQNPVQSYEVIAYLANELMGLNSASTNPTIEASQNALQYAIWSVLQPNSLNNITGTLYNQALTDYQNAVAAVTGGHGLTQAQLDDFTIYTPNSVVSCGYGVSSCSTPQEFIVMTPEPGTLLMLGLGLGFLAMTVRRRKSAASLNLA